MQLPYICKCFICGRKYKSKSGLWRHLTKHKPIIELLQTRIEKEPVKNPELLQTRIEKVPDKLVENTIVKTHCYDNDPSPDKKKKRIKREKKKKKDPEKKFHAIPRQDKKEKKKISRKQICAIKLAAKIESPVGTMPDPEVFDSEKVAPTLLEAYRYI